MLAMDIRSTSLFRKLEASPSRPLSPDNVERLCAEAADHMRQMPAFHRQFTLHDSKHLLNVTELMGRILGPDHPLNALEIALLILAAHFHDCGMVPDEPELKASRQSTEFKLHRELWASDHANVGEIEQQLAATHDDDERRELASKLAELEAAMWSDFLRIHHGEASARLLRSRYGQDKRLEADNVPVVDLLATLCESHVHDPAALEALPVDKRIGTHQVNVRFLAVALRLADILDFDRERTPDALYKTIHFTNDVSLLEWEKHRGVVGWQIGPDLVRFDMEFDHPVYERTARQFLDYIDIELGAAFQIVKNFPSRFAHYTLPLPLRVDRTRIGPRNQAYVYHDLEFSLSRDEIVKLLMTENLYGSASLCVRELLQNSLDALRYRHALIKADGLEWRDGRVEFEHTVDDRGVETLSCVDNGVGMDESVIVGFLTRVGRSFYRSPYFEQERARFRQKGVDFDPCSRFGIGFMSCFMLGDRIRIETRRHYGGGRAHGKPWVVEINGLGSIVTLRPGPATQNVGTRVTVTCRPPTDEELAALEQGPASSGDTAEAGAPRDRVALVETLRDYARAVEYPVQARRRAPGRDDSERFGERPLHPSTYLERLGLRDLVRFERDVRDYDDSGNLSGYVAQSFLRDPRGAPGLANAEATWMTQERYGQEWKPLTTSEGHRVEAARLRLASGTAAPPGKFAAEAVICADGIAVHHGSGQGGTAPPGVPRVERAFVIDTRGRAKPPLTPARTVQGTSPGYQALWNAIYKADVDIWTDLALMLPDGLEHDIWWKLAELYNAPLHGLPMDVAWNKVGVREHNTRRTIALADVGVAYRDEGNVPPFASFVTEGGIQIDGRDDGRLLAFSELGLDSASRLCLRVARDHASSEYDRYPIYSASAVKFSRDLAGALYAAMGTRSVRLLLNAHHPLSLHCAALAYRNPAKRFVASLLSADPTNPTRDNYRLRDLKTAGSLYRQIDWKALDPGLRPPYRVISGASGWVDITEAQIIEWAALQIADDPFS
jgi:hypothetical protein